MGTGPPLSLTPQTVLGDVGLAVGLLALASFIMVTVGGALFIAGAGVLLAVNIQSLQGEEGGRSTAVLLLALPTHGPATWLSCHSL